MRTEAAGWNFDQFGSEFDEHVAAHLPGYADVQRLISLIASHVLPEGGVLADLGCSTGATAGNLLDTVSRSFTGWLYDADASMLDQAAIRLAGRGDIHLIEGDLTRLDLRHARADLTLCLWLLQFLPPQQRLPLMVRARRHASPEGCIVVAAKTQHADPRWEQIAVAALDDYKAEMGVDAETRAVKTRSLRGALHTQGTGQIGEDLLKAGWHSPAVIWRWHVWTVVGAWANPPGSEL